MNLRVAYTDENEEFGVEIVPACGGVGVTGIAVLPDPEIHGIGRVLNNTTLAPRTQMRSLETMPTAQYNGQDPGSSLKRLWVFVYTRI